MSDRAMTIGGVTFNPDKLMSQAEMLDFLREYGESDKGLSKIRDKQQAGLGGELIWCCPLMDGKNLGRFIAAVKEGFLSLPYFEVDSDDYEILDLDGAELIDAEAMQFHINSWRRFSDDLSAAMNDMLRELGGSSGQ